ncbi:unnamed protein product [Arabidopsis arenosa]|uniref:mitogen-activated protein kinase kinase n=1 Tax=Arabidopsis arenosa TaxID=38785 RepID=A0A8S2AS01_ARAAE|nr:unnamed protein product [Arabidopsis arenosa]
MNRGGLCPNPICLPPLEQSISKFLTQSGTFKDGDLRVNKDGIQIVSQSEPGAPPPIEPLDNQLSLADLEVIKVIGKGCSGNVQLVKHKLTQQFFALKVIQLNTEESTCRAISQELRINLSSQCPYLVSCYQSFYHNGLVSIILEFMDGGSLADLLKKVEKVPENMLAAICKRLILSWAHTPICLQRELAGVCTVTRAISGAWDWFLLECATGKFPYIPPEHKKGWSSVYELVDAIVENPPPCAPSHLFSPEFCSFISQCVQKEPRDRKSAQELLEHKFVNMFEDSDMNLSAYFTDAGSLIPPLANY